jgi:hypothetical protein
VGTLFSMACLVCEKAGYNSLKTWNRSQTSYFSIGWYAFFSRRGSHL